MSAAERQAQAAALARERERLLQRSSL